MMAKKLNETESPKQKIEKKAELPSEKKVDLRAEVLSVTDTGRGYYEVLMAVTGKVKLEQKFELK